MTDLWMYLLAAVLIPWLFRQVRDSALSRLLTRIRFIEAGLGTGLLVGDYIFRFRHSWLNLLVGIPMFLLMAVGLAWAGGPGTPQTGAYEQGQRLRWNLLPRTAAQFAASLVVGAVPSALARGRMTRPVLGLAVMISTLLVYLPNFFKVAEDSGPSAGSLVRLLLKRVASRRDTASGPSEAIHT